MWYIVGLGNPGAEYEQTRHNVGWLALDAVLQTMGLPAPIASRQYSGSVSEGVWQGHEIVCLYPDTFMNHSGSAVAKLIPKGSEARLIVLYDDVDIPLGDVKLSFGRGDGGHNGVKSIIAELDTRDFIRVRIGVAHKGFFGQVKRPSGDRLSQYVMGNFTKRELRTVADVSEHVGLILADIMHDGIEKAMNEWNR